MATTDIIRAEVRSEGGFLPWLMAPERRGPLLVAPAIIVLFLMNIFPLLWSFGLSFYNYRANRQTVPSFEGLENYGRVLNDPVIWERFQTTALIVGSSVLLQLVLGFLLALLFERQFPLRRLLLTLVLTPMMLSPVAVGVFFKLYYEPTFGLVSQFINNFITGEPFALLATPMGAVIGIVVADAWMWSPFVMLLVLPAWSACPSISTRRPRLTARPGGDGSARSPSPTSAACCSWRSCSGRSRPSSCSTWSTSSPRAVPARPRKPSASHLSRGVPELPHQPVDRARLHCAVRRDRADQPVYLRGKPPQPGANLMAAKRSSQGRVGLDRVRAKSHDLLLPVSWIILTAFQCARRHAVVPPMLSSSLSGTIPSTYSTPPHQRR